MEINIISAEEFLIQLEIISIFIDKQIDESDSASSICNNDGCDLCSEE